MTRTNQTGAGKSFAYRKKLGKKCVVCGLYKSENTFMHKTPKNLEAKELWSKAIGKELIPSSIICNNHFKRSDYKPNTTRKLLKPGAVPSQFKSSYSIAKTQTITQSEKCPDSNLSYDQFENKNSVTYLSDQNTEDSNSQEEEQCYIYYLDEKQNVGVFESSASHDFVKNIDSTAKKIISPSSLEIYQENSSSNMDIDSTQSISNSCTKAKSLGVSNSQCSTVLQNLSLEPFIGLNSSHFTTKLAWQMFCDIISEYREQIYDLQDHNNILQTKINRLKGLLNIHITKI